jgi:hypothetical protein
MSSLDELLYKEKYLKYKKKYIQLKEYQDGGNIFSKIRTSATSVTNAVSTGATHVNKAVSTRVSNTTKRIYPTAYIIAKHDELKKIHDMNNNISEIVGILNLKGYIIKSNDPTKIKLIGAKGILSKVGDSKNDFVDSIALNKTYKGEISKISTYIDKIIKGINFINNNDSTKKLSNNNIATGETDPTGETGETDPTGETGETGVTNSTVANDSTKKLSNNNIATGETDPTGETGETDPTGETGETGVTNSTVANNCQNIKCYFNNIIINEKKNKEYLNSIKQIINNNDKIKLKRKVGTYSYKDEIDINGYNIFEIKYYNKINEIKKEVYKQLINQKSDIKSISDNDLKKLSHIFIEYKNVLNTDADITFYL